MNQRALYYPYIHIHDVNWLKATLLLFSEVRRMLPGNFTPDDSEEVRAFAERSPSLLSGANLWTRRANAAQKALARRLSADAQDATFRSKYGRAATRQDLLPDDQGFQIHQQKLAKPLKDALRSTGLAWTPHSPELYDLYEAYVELHPRIGEAVMSTLAIAAATGEGLDIVGDQRSGHLHSCLLERKLDEIYDAWLHPPPVPPPPPPDAEDLFEFLVGFPCDVTALTPDTLAKLQQDREPLRKLIEQLRAMAPEIPAMDVGRERETYFRDVTSKVLKEWGRDRSNMSAYWRKFFGEGLSDTSQKFVEKVAEKLTGVATAGGAGAAATTAAVGGGGAAAMATAAVAGAGVGLAIGVVFHGVKTYFRMRGAERDSPYRYLTLMEQAGVVFRSDLGTAPRPVPRIETMAAKQVTIGEAKQLFGIAAGKLGDAASNAKSSDAKNKLQWGLRIIAEEDERLNGLRNDHDAYRMLGNAFGHGKKELENIKNDSRSLVHTIQTATEVAQALDPLIALFPQ